MRFTNQFAILTSLKTLLLTQGVRIREEDAPLLSFGKLNHLRYDEKGRLPCACRKSNSHIQMVKSAEEWRLHNAANGMNSAR
jgi:hypothetical protein